MVEALTHGGIENGVSVKIRWVDSEAVTDENAHEKLSGVDGVLVPGGFGDRGIEGMIAAVRYARENKIPFFGICLGMQMAVIETARHLCGMEDAHSGEFSQTTQHPVIALMPDQVGVTAKGGTMRLGSCPCRVTGEDTLTPSRIKPTAPWTLPSATATAMSSTTSSGRRWWRPAA